MNQMNILAVRDIIYPQMWILARYVRKTINVPAGRIILMKQTTKELNNAQIQPHLHRRGQLIRVIRTFYILVMMLFILNQEN